MKKKVFPNETVLNLYLISVIKEYRTNAELSQKELSIKMGHAEDYIYKIENRKVKISLEFLRKFTTVFDTDISTILRKAEENCGIHE